MLEARQEADEQLVSVVERSAAAIAARDELCTSKNNAVTHENDDLRRRVTELEEALGAARDEGERLRAEATVLEVHPTSPPSPPVHAYIAHRTCSFQARHLMD